MWVRFSKKWDYIVTKYTICYADGQVENVPRHIGEKAVSLGVAEKTRSPGRANKAETEKSVNT